MERPEPAIKVSVQPEKKRVVTTRPLHMASNLTATLTAERKQRKAKRKAQRQARRK